MLNEVEQKLQTSAWEKLLVKAVENFLEIKRTNHPDGIFFSVSTNFCPKEFGLNGRHSDLLICKKSAKHREENYPSIECVACWLD